MLLHAQQSGCLYPEACSRLGRGYIEEYELGRKEMLKNGSVNLQRVYETIAYVTWYLDSNRSQP